MLKAALSNVATACALLEQARGIVEDEPDAAPESKASLPAGRASKPRASRKRASAGGAGPVAAPSVPSPAAEPPASPAAPAPSVQSVSPIESAILARLASVSEGGILARQLVEGATGSKAVKDHGPAYAALKALEASGRVFADGRRYWLGVAK